MGDFERPGVLAAQAGQRRRITPSIRGNLLGRAQAGRNCQHHAIEEVPAGDALHESTLIRAAQSDLRCREDLAAMCERPGSPHLTHGHMRENSCRAARGGRRHRVIASGAAVDGSHSGSRY
jgi:hypothetical protein